MISYSVWFKQHGEKHKEIVDKLIKNNYNQNKIIEYFEYENLKKNEPNFCPLFAQNKKCHNIQNLNCYFCGCPNFRFDDNSSYCAINSKDGAKIISQNNKIHQNCINCMIPHHKEYIEKNFSLDWFEVMKEVEK